MRLLRLVATVLLVYAIPVSAEIVASQFSDDPGRGFLLALLPPFGYGYVLSSESIVFVIARRAVPQTHSNRNLVIVAALLATAILWLAAIATTLNIAVENGYPI